MKKNELSNRLFEFARCVILLIRQLPEQTEIKIIKYQLVKSAGANYEEAQGGSSKADFVYKVEISLREMRESNYWLRLLKETGDKFDELMILELNNLIDESDQLKKILGSIIVKVKTKTN